MTQIIWTASAILGALFLLCQIRFVILMGVSRRTPEPPPPNSESPLVAVQIASYRESAVLSSLLEAVAKLDWPRDRLMVQVLDDSPADDATRINEIVAAHAARGLPVSCHRRGTREGFKAGALNHGLEIAGEAEFIAYFDADCRPDAQFLRRVMRHLADRNVAAVQARWRFPNALASPLTALQAAAFEYLFAYDYPVRAQLGLPAYYLGSAAVWRRAVPLSLGGWHFKPFTAEDVDMGLRAANAGWKIAYEAQVLAEDDAVEDVLAFRAQQRRWAQAVLRAGLTAVSSLPRSRQRPWSTLMDWTSFAPHALIPLTPLLTVCLASWVLWGIPAASGPFWGFTALMVISPATLALVLSQKTLHPQDWRQRVRRILAAGPFAAATMSSFLCGFRDFLRPEKLEFVATPKAKQTGVIGGQKKPWLRSHIGPMLLDGGFALYFGAAAAVAVHDGVISAILPLILMSVIFLSSAFLTGGELARRAQAEASSAPASA